MEIAETLHYIADVDAWHGPTGLKRCQRRVANAGRRGAGRPRTRTDFQRGIRNVGLSTSPTNHHALVSPTSHWQDLSGYRRREALVRLALTARQGQRGIPVAPVG
eukprot:6212480-Pleurochrysis_carterae.AAC.2